MSGVVYTETIVYSPPEAFLNDAPYQLAIVALEGGGRVTARILGEAIDFARQGEMAARLMPGHAAANRR